MKRTLTEDVIYPAHDPRTESSTFVHTKSVGKKADTRCVISGSPLVEYHHLFCEWAFMEAVDWQVVKNIALGIQTEFEVYDPLTMIKSGEKIDIKKTLIYMIIEFIKFRGFDFANFDITKPETLVDSAYQMLPIHEKVHRGVNHGIHAMSGPIWLFQAFTKVEGYAFSPDELELIRKTHT